MTYGVILAGGIGSRMGGDKPKQYLTIKGKPIIIYTIEKFLVVPEFEKVIVLCPKQWVEHTKNLIEKHIAPAKDRVAVIEGGSTRNETIMNAVKLIESEGNLNDDTIIVTHDSVRPFVTHRIIEENIKAIALPLVLCNQFCCSLFTLAAPNERTYTTWGNHKQPLLYCEE